MPKLSLIVIAAVLIVGGFGLSILSYYEHWLTNLSEFTTLVLSTVVAAMFIGAGAFVWRAFKREELKSLAGQTIPSADEGSYESKAFGASIPNYRPYRAGMDSVTFRATYEGWLNNGYFNAHIVGNGKEKDVPDPKSIPDLAEGRLGSLRGKALHAGLWQWSIPTEWPKGVYDIKVECVDIRMKERVTTQKTFRILQRLGFLDRTMYNIPRVEVGHTFFQAQVT